MSIRIKFTAIGLLLLISLSIGAYFYLSESSFLHQKGTNRLAQASSPYLLQHAHNPVDWYEWGEEALSRAKKEDKPILLSIGYASCHWCHVMERESFENEEIARIMNENFICIKVDREERPDIDQVYMEALQAMGMGGGWPLNMFLTPDQKPFYGGTYFAPEEWANVLQQIGEAYQQKRDEIEASAEELRAALAQSELAGLSKPSENNALQSELQEIYEQLEANFDTLSGGIKATQKFVMPANWLMLLRYYKLSGNQKALQQINTTLKRVAMGGIHDQLGGGFARYTVDERWHIPHFEKMLYDNAQLMSLYAEAYRLSPDPEYKALIEDMLRWLQRDMSNEEGGFYSSIDADSEGAEGSFYVWNYQEFDQLLGQDAALVADYYSVEEKGNWEEDRNILIRQQADSLFLQKHGLQAADWQQRLRAAKQQLLAYRAQRPHPSVDDKMITSWNAMLISGLTDAYRALGQKEFLEAAERNIGFIEQKLMKDRRLFRSYKGRPSAAQGFLDDYAFLIQAYINLYQVTFKEAYILKARDLLDYTLEQFWDEKEAFFFYTSHESEALINRKKEVYDQVIPASNSVMARNLFYLGTIFDQYDWKRMSSDMSHSMAALIKSEPGYMGNWAIAYMESKSPVAEVIFSGPDIEPLREEFQASYYPFAISMGTESKSSLPLLEGKEATGENTIYVCFNKTCKLPVSTVAEAIRQMPAGIRESQSGKNTWHVKGEEGSIVSK
jgi:uncharacterized protein YyaL (SSP411 family)